MASARCNRWRNCRSDRGGSGHRRPVPFRGSWSIGVGLRGVHGIAAYGENQGFQDGWKFSEDDYDESVEVDFERLRSPGGPVLDSLLGRLLRATKGSSDEISLMDPFSD